MNKEQIHSFNVAIPLFNPIANEIKSLTGIWINLQHIPTAQVQCSVVVVALMF